jgi:nicotinate-nucleotide--dimethylbenzimidazole phosphoribosyltransferase
MTSDFTQQAWCEMGKKTKPPGSLGQLEETAVRVAVLQQTLKPSLDKKRLILFASNHGIVEEGVSPYPQMVTEQMVLNFLSGGAAVNVLAKHGGIDLIVVDVGVGAQWSQQSLSRKDFYAKPVHQGTRNFLKEPAMVPEEYEQAIQIGREFVKKAVFDDMRLIGFGEMGIGNTTSASAVISGILKWPVDQVIGRGAGADDVMVKRKQSVIQKAMDLYRSKAPQSEADVAKYWLQVVGGYEIVAMVGAILEAVEQKLPVVIDGFIVTSAVLAAYFINPSVKEICFFGHCSAENAHRHLLEYFNAKPLLQLGLRLGEGTGAVLAMHLMDASAKILSEMATFESAGVSGKN